MFLPSPFKRFFAFLIDFFLCYFVYFSFCHLLSNTIDNKIFSIAIFFIIWHLYMSFFEWKINASIGKKLFKIEVAFISGSFFYRLTFFRSLLRQVLKTIGFVLFFPTIFTLIQSFTKPNSYSFFHDIYSKTTTVDLKKIK